MNPQTTQLLVIDPQVEDYQQLAVGIQPEVQLLILDQNRNGIEQITKYLTSLPACQQGSRGAREQGSKGDGETGRRGDGETGRRGDWG
ncbi:MAG TPA: DUF4347 domain-containing protein, partial [Oscillatoriaceae cyanobacterium M33_DOE_052]|nr:DUF4347 domain-containing protein [Oscillatoriaceae cyanobacterium M33_DOE_052]